MAMQRTFQTPKGTQLPLLNLRGKEYLEVKFRIVWFREEHPDWSIETELKAVTEESAYARATIKDEQGRIIATSHKFESRRGFPDFIEKSETGAIGRALALIGYGTQFCADELDEGARLADAPVAQKEQAKVPESLSATNDPGDFEIKIGRKYKGKKLKDVPLDQLISFAGWLDLQAEKRGQPLDQEAVFFKVAVGRYEESLNN